MEALIVLADIVCMLVLGLSLVRLERGKKPDLGVFSYKEERSPRPDASAANSKGDGRNA